MNIGNALGFPAPTAALKRTDASKATSDVEAPRSAQSSAQFAAFLTMLVGNNPQLRSDLMKQLPENSAGLIDTLLASGEAVEGDDTALLGKTVQAAAPQPTVSTNDAARALGVDTSAADAVRYGMMTDAVRNAPQQTSEVEALVEPKIEVSAPTTTPTPTKSAAPAITHAERNAIYRQEAQSILTSMRTGATFDENGIDATAKNRISPSVLARVTSRQSSSLEELIAVGDTEAASLRVKLDNVLAKSGTDEGMMLAASHAASSALGAALAASATDPNTPIKDLDAVDPELRARLSRVIDRMKNEFGHDVTVVETARSQERQDVLYAQGRTTPGNVVTQTLNSMHTHGEAVDLLVDGDWNNTQGFQRLQQVAKEEGLKTLGMKDPGHVELPKDLWTMEGADVRVASVTNNGPVSNGIAHVATVARVASVGAGMPVAPTQPEIPAIPQAPQPTINTNGAAGLMPQQRDTNTQSDSQPSTDSKSDTASKKSTLKSTDKVESRAAQAYQETPTDLKAKFIGPVEDAQPSASASATNAVDRVNEISTMREQQGARPLTQLTMNVDNVDGTSQQIKIDVRGNAVGTQISTDSVNANRLRAHADELRTGLESRGLQSDSVRISTQNTRATDGADAVKHTTIERDAMRMNGAGNSTFSDQSAQQGARDKSSAARDWEDKQASRDEQRAQNRDAQGRGSGNQDRQRPQYQEKK